MTGDVFQLDILQVVPDPFSRVQVWGIARQLLQIQPSSSALCQESLDCLVSMDRCPIPDHQHLAVDVPEQVSEETHHIYSLERSLLHTDQQLPRFGYSTNYRQMIPRERHSQHWRLAMRGIAAHKPGQQVEGRFVYPHDSSPLPPCLFLSAGQRFEYQAAMAPSVRCVARR